MNTNDKKMVSRQSKTTRKIVKTLSIYLTESESEQFEKVIEKYQVRNKSNFVISRILNNQIKSVIIDPIAIEYHSRLTQLINHFKAIAVNYNTLVQKSQEQDKKLEVYQQLFKETIDLSKLCKDIITLTLDFEKIVIDKQKEYDS
ncbi:hypothetical protein GJV76_10480 [Myroides sp. BIT-d1]|uniref:Mobilization protein n=1 Tax=Myroides albus TaxID=2562892 RepID=A0A6I3LRE5_9FLAO|nr:hypothetical protein [Myroides albus]MTG98545.1 hypothetical protein [Myroides albus]